MLYEAPPGTAHERFLRYQETDGAGAHFNAAALIFGVANAIEDLAGREQNGPLSDYAAALKKALISTVDAGTVTGDLKGKTIDPNSEVVVDMHGFLNAVEERLAALLAETPS